MSRDTSEIPVSKAIKKRTDSSSSLFSRLFRRSPSPEVTSESLELKRKRRFDPVYAVMSNIDFDNIGLRMDSEVNVIRFVQKTNSEGNWVYIANTSNYDDCILKISNSLNKVDKYSDVRYRNPDEEITVNILGHGDIHGIEYSGATADTRITVPISKFISDIAKKTKRSSIDQRFDFFISGCQLGVGIASTSNDPAKIARRQKQEKELQENLPKNTICLVGAGNKTIVSAQVDQTIIEIAKQKYSVPEKAMLMASIMPNTFKLVYKDKKGRLFTHKSNFILPQDNQTITVEYARQQIVQRFSELISFAKTAGLKKSERNDLKNFAQELEKKLSDEYVNQYIFELVRDKSRTNKRFGIIWSQLDSETKEDIFKNEKFGIIVQNLLYYGSYKTALQVIGEYESKGLSDKVDFIINGQKLSISIKEKKETALKQLEIQRNIIKEFLENQKIEGARKVILDEKFLLLADTLNKREFVETILEEARKAGLKIEVLVTKEAFTIHKKNLKEIISDEAEFKICKSEDEKTKLIEEQKANCLNFTNKTSLLTIDILKDLNNSFRQQKSNIFSQKLQRVKKLIIDVNLFYDGNKINPEKYNQFREFLNQVKQENPQLAANIHLVGYDEKVNPLHELILKDGLASMFGANQAIRHDQIFSFAERVNVSKIKNKKDGGILEDGEGVGFFCSKEEFEKVAIGSTAKVYLGDQIQIVKSQKQTAQESSGANSPQSSSTQVSRNNSGNNSPSSSVASPQRAVQLKDGATLGNSTSA